MRHVHLGDLLKKCKEIDKVVVELKILVDDIIEDLTFNEDDNENNS